MQAHINFNDKKLLCDISEEYPTIHFVLSTQEDEYIGSASACHVSIEQAGILSAEGHESYCIMDEVEIEPEYAGEGYDELLKDICMHRVNEENKAVDAFLDNLVA